MFLCQQTWLFSPRHHMHQRHQHHLPCPQTQGSQAQKVSHRCIAVDTHPQKAEPEQTQLTIGGAMLDCNGPITTETANIATAGILLNGIVSTDKAKFCCFDVKNSFAPPHAQLQMHSIAHQHHPTGNR